MLWQEFTTDKFANLQNELVKQWISGLRPDNPIEMVGYSDINGNVHDVLTNHIIGTI